MSEIIRRYNQVVDVRNAARQWGHVEHERTAQETLDLIEAQLWFEGACALREAHLIACPWLDPRFLWAGWEARQRLVNRAIMCP